MNLDCMTYEELMEFWMENKLGTTEERVLATYAKNKADAIFLREAGAIQAAMKLEATCDWIYGKLPQNLRW